MISGQFLNLLQQGALFIPSYGSLVTDTSGLQRLPLCGWEDMPGLWWHLFSTQLKRHALFSLLSTVKAGYENMLGPLKRLHML